MSPPRFRLVSTLFLVLAAGCGGGGMKAGSTMPPEGTGEDEGDAGSPAGPDARKAGTDTGAGPAPADTGTAPPESDAAPLPPAADGGAPPASAGDEGLRQLLVSSAIGLGYYTACHIMPDTSVRCFGDRHPRTMPPTGLRTKQITCSHDGCCALLPKEAGERIRCWSDKTTIIPPAAVSRMVDPLQISIGYQHGCALNVDHSVTCWGQPGTMNAPPAGLKAKSLAVASYFNCAVQLDDSVVCWGINPPQPPPGLKAKLVAAVFHGGLHLEEAKGGTRHACAIQLDDTVKCWGDNIEGTTDVPADLGPVKDIAGSTYNTCAIKPDNQMVCWGTKHWFPDRYRGPPPNLRLKAIRGKFAAYCAIQTDDTIVCWGEQSTTHLNVPPGVKAFIP